MIDCSDSQPPRHRANSKTIKIFFVIFTDGYPFLFFNHSMPISDTLPKNQIAKMTRATAITHLIKTPKTTISGNSKVPAKPSANKANKTNKPTKNSFIILLLQSGQIRKRNCDLRGACRITSDLVRRKINVHIPLADPEGVILLFQGSGPVIDPTITTLPQLIH